MFSKALCTILGVGDSGLSWTIETALGCRACWRSNCDTDTFSDADLSSSIDEDEEEQIEIEDEEKDLDMVIMVVSVKFCGLVRLW